MTRLSRDDEPPNVSNAAALMVFGPGAVIGIAATWPWSLPAIGATFLVGGMLKQRKESRQGQAWQFICSDARKVSALVPDDLDVVNDVFWQWVYECYYKNSEGYAKTGFKEGALSFSSEADYIRSIGPRAMMSFIRGRSRNEEYPASPWHRPRDSADFILPERGAPWPYHDRDIEASRAR